jgi:hypothetical protein
MLGKENCDSAVSDFISWLWTANECNVELVDRVHRFARDTEQIFSFWSQLVRLLTILQCQLHLFSKQLDQKRKEKTLKCFQVVRKWLGSPFAWTTVHVNIQNCPLTEVCPGIDEEMKLRTVMCPVDKTSVFWLSDFLWLYCHMANLVIYIYSLLLGKYNPINSSICSSFFLQVF